MTMASINKVKFASINDKRYGSDGIVSLPFGHHLLSEVREYKKSLPKILTVIEIEKDKILKLENDAFSNSKRLRVLRSIYSQPITYCRLNEKNTLKIKSVDKQRMIIF